MFITDLMVFSLLSEKTKSRACPGTWAAHSPLSHQLPTLGISVVMGGEVAISSTHVVVPHIRVEASSICALPRPLVHSL